MNHIDGVVQMRPELEIGACPVAEVMGTELFTLSPDPAVASARRLVMENDIDHMLVLDNGTLAGIICKEDLRDADRDGCVGDCMTSPVVCITPDTTLQEAIDIMGANDIDCLPVVTGTFLVGIVTWNGLASAELTPRILDVASDSSPRRPSRGRRGQSKGSGKAKGTFTWMDSADACAVCGAVDEAAPILALGRLPLCVRCRHLESFSRVKARG
jgi:CBS domain-containing protein